MSSRAQVKESERAPRTYQANWDARRAEKVGRVARVEDKGQRWLLIWRDGPEAQLEAVQQGQEDCFE